MTEVVMIVAIVLFTLTNGIYIVCDTIKYNIDKDLREREQYHRLEREQSDEQTTRNRKAHIM